MTHCFICSLSRTQDLITQISRICQEIRDIKGRQINNNLFRTRPERTSTEINTSPLKSNTQEDLCDKYDKGDLHCTRYEDTIDSEVHRTPACYNPDNPTDHGRDLALQSALPLERHPSLSKYHPPSPTSGTTSEPPFGLSDDDPEGRTVGGGTGMASGEFPSASPE